VASVIQGILGLGLVLLGAIFTGMGISGKVQPPMMTFLLGFVFGVTGWILVVDLIRYVV
jgi:hypothetical protein